MNSVLVLRRVVLKHLVGDLQVVFALFSSSLSAVLSKRAGCDIKPGMRFTFSLSGLMRRNRIKNISAGIINNEAISSALACLWGDSEERVQRGKLHKL